MSLDRDLGRRLRDAPVPDEAQAEARSWEIVRSAYAERTPMPPARRARRLALAAVGGAAALAIGLSPAGAKVGDLAENMAEAVGIGADDAKPALRSLPAAGELLVESEAGPWIVREDGSKRLLGDYDEASWSPRGLFVAVAEGRELIAVDPAGQVRWTIDAPGRVSDPRWGGIGFDTRIAYRSGEDLWVVDGDGGDERLLARNVAPVAPAWRPPEAELKLSPERVRHVLTYATEEMEIRAIDVDATTQRPTNPGDADLLSAPAHGQDIGPTTSPDGRSVAAIRPQGRRTELVLSRTAGGTRVLFVAAGELTGPTWSPDGEWLLVGWPEADQWVFIRADSPGRIVAVDGISEQFDPGGDGAASFPRAGGWILPQR